MMNADRMLAAPLSSPSPTVLAISDPRLQLLALGVGSLLMVGLASLGVWLIRLALKPR